MSWTSLIRTCGSVLILAALVVVSPEAAGAAAPTVTFTKDVAPILFTHCAGCHHPGASAPFSLLTYQDAKARARLIAQTTERRVMPPWQPLPEGPAFRGARRLADADIRTLRQWVEAGAPEGDAGALPPAPALTTGWQLGKPDLVLTMPEAFDVPAGGPDFFRNFVLPVPNAGLRYVQAVEFQPGNARVVHHVRVLVDETGASREQDAGDTGPGFSGMDTPGARAPDGYFLGWAPGKVPKREAAAWPLRPGADIVVQAHLRPSGKAERVQVSVGLYFSDTPPAFAPAMVQMGSRTLDIPAGSASYLVTDRYQLPVAARVVRVAPHAHYLGQNILLRAVPPSGSPITLLHIRNWDFNWQDDYDYAEPVTLPAGTTLALEFSYDNSEANPRNPNRPPKRVQFGSQASDEMCEVLLQVVPEAPADLPRLVSSIDAHSIEVETEELRKRATDHPDDGHAWSALANIYMQTGRFDDGARAFEAAFRLLPDDGVAAYNVGQVAFARQDYALARERLERAVTLKPDLVEAQTTLAATLSLAGDRPGAITHLRAALAVRPGHAPAAVNLSRLLTADGAHDASIAVIDTALRTRPRDPALLDALAQAKSAAGRQAPVVDLDGRPVLVPEPGAKATVVVFAETDCPISNRYAPELRRLYDAFAPKGVAFVTVYPNPTDTADVIRKHLAAYALPLRAVRDTTGTLVARTGATITPEVAVFDAQGRLVYRGRIDDRYVSIGVERAAPTRRDLEEVLTAAAAGRSLTPRTTEAVGCFIADMTR